MKELWLLVMAEMTHAGKNSIFQATVITPEGKSSKQDVIRMGTFSAFSNGNFLRYIPQNQELLIIGEQPSLGRGAAYRVRFMDRFHIFRLWIAVINDTAACLNI